MVEQQAPKLGRPPKGDARTETMRVRVMPTSKVEFVEAARARGYEPADALREAMVLWQMTVEES